MSAPDNYDTLFVQRGAEEAFRIAADDARKLRALYATRFTAPIVCICGSTRFKQAWIAENARLTGEGNIVLAVGLWGHHERKFPDAKTKAFLDNLHLRKIDLCDWVWVLNIGGYIGESTRNEIRYAEELGKTVRYLSNEFPGYIEPEDPIRAAKELLEACKLAVFNETKADDLRNSGMVDNVDIKALRAIASAARAAIAKAEGKQ